MVQNSNIYSLAGTHVAVVGASSGMGAAIAKQASVAGARVTLLGRDAGSLDSVAANIADARTMTIDLTRPETVAAAASRIGPVDHLVITSGTYRNVELASSEPEIWRDIMEERVIGPLHLVKALASQISSSITFFAGTMAWRPFAGSAPMAAAVAGVVNMSRALALELSPVRVNCVAPGMVDTPFVDGLFGTNKAQVVADAAQSMPAKRVGTPEDVAHATLLLMTNPYMTGSSLVIDGGGILV